MLVSMTAGQRREWSAGTFEQLCAETTPDDHITVLAGRYYREPLCARLRARGNDLVVPTARMGIGKQLQWLDRVNSSAQRLLDLDHLYRLLARLHAVRETRQLSTSTGNLVWPDRGVYCFFEPDEFRATHPIEARIVRVGTHCVSRGSKSTLWQRLRAHRGPLGGGNHRSSVFRLHVGSALQNQDRAKHVATWGRGQSASKAITAKEAELERLVSTYIGAMHVSCVEVSDPPGALSDRAYIESNCIGLIASGGGPLDPPSINWLGNSSPHESIRSSGLWNVNHVYGGYDPRFLEVLEYYIDATIAGQQTNAGSRAPVDWRLRKQDRN